MARTHTVSDLYNMLQMLTLDTKSIGEKVTNISQEFISLTLKVDKMSDDKVTPMDKQLALVMQSHSRLEKLVYGCLTAVALQVLGSISAIIVFLVTRK